MEISEDNVAYDMLLEIEDNEAAEKGEVLSFEQFSIKSFIILGRQVVRAIAYIHQLYLNKKISGNFNKNSRGYKARRKEFVDKYIKQIEASIERDDVYTHLPSFAEDGRQFLEGIFDATVGKYNAADKEKFNQDVIKELEN